MHDPSPPGVPAYPGLLPRTLPILPGSDIRSHCHGDAPGEMTVGPQVRTRDGCEPPRAGASSKHDHRWTVTNGEGD